MARREYKPGVPTTLAAAISSSATTIYISTYVNWPTGADGNFWVTIDAGTAQEERVLCATHSSGSITVTTRGVDGTTASSHAQGASIWPSWSATDANESNAHIESTGYASYSKAVHGLGSSDGVVVGTDKSQTLTAKTLTAPTITSPTITSPTISGTITGAVVTSANIVDGTITGTDVASGTITSANILDGTILNADINASAAIAATKLTGTTAEFNTALSDNDFATLAGTETLTNKTLTSPTITGLGFDAWTSYTPVAKLGSTTLTSGSTTGLYTVVGKTVTVIINDSTYLTGSRAVQDLNISLPFATTGGTYYGAGYLQFQDGSGVYYTNTATVSANGSTLYFLRNDVQQTYASPTTTNNLYNFGTMNSSTLVKNCTITYQKA